MKIHFISLGCDKNLVDSEQMLSILYGRGYELTDDDREADIIIINSCCFINDAKEESINTIIEEGRLKEEGKLKFLIVAGCLAERYSEEIEKELPEVDAVVGTTAFDGIADVIDRLLEDSGEKKESLVKIKKNTDTLTNPEVERFITTPGHYEYLKIAEGCDKNCAYCIIPKIRGHFRSIPMERLVSDAEKLAEKGVKELILVAQETTVYGKDLYGQKMLPGLLQKLCRVEGIEWIRLLYCYPEEIDDELIKVIRDEKKICHYLDLPIQHCSDRILKRMGRRTSEEDIVNLIGKLRKEIPDIALRTTLITGFPGESDEDQEKLRDFVKKIRFDRLGVFTYSPEEGTRAASFEDQIEEEVKEKRRDEIMSLQQEISLSVQETRVGEIYDCMIEGRIPEEHVYVGRTYRDAPNVDGYIFINDEKIRGELMTGDMISVKITGASEYDLEGEPVEKDESAK